MFSSPIQLLATIDIRLKWSSQPRSSQLPELKLLKKSYLLTHSSSPTIWRLNVKVLVVQSCLTLCNAMDYSPPGSLVRGIFQARILDWGAVPFSRGSSQPRNWTWVSSIAGGIFIVWTTGEAKTADVVDAKWTTVKTAGNNSHLVKLKVLSISRQSWENLWYLRAFCCVIFQLPISNI